jgi:hypothetical protein
MSDDGVNDASPAAPVDVEPVAVENVLFNTSISFEEVQQAVRQTDEVVAEAPSEPEPVKSINVPAPQSQIAPSSTVTNRHISRMSRHESIKSRHDSILSERTLLGTMDDDDLEVSQEHLVDSPFYWHQPKSEHDFDNWPQYADQVTDLRDIGVSQVAIDEAYLAGSPTFAEIDDDTFETINLQNLRREYYQESMEFKPDSEALRSLEKWEMTYRDAVDSLTGQEHKDARKIWVGSKNLFEGHLKSTTPTLWLLFDIFPGFLHPLIMKFSKWKPRVARNMENQPISGPRNMLDLLAFGNLVAFFTILGFAVPIWSSMGTRLDDTPLLTAQQCAYMSPSVSAKSFATPGQFLMNRSWSMDMFATVGVISGFNPVGNYFSKEWKAANMTMPTMKSCVISTPFSLKLDADAKPNAIVEQGGYRMNTGVPLVFNISGFAMGSLQKNISSCVSYNDMKIGSPYVNSKRGLTDVILVTVLYVLCFVIIGYNIYQSKTMAVAFQNRSILIDTRNTIQVYGQTYRWEIVAVIYLICMFAFTAVSEVHCSCVHLFFSIRLHLITKFCLWLPRCMSLCRTAPSTIIPPSVVPMRARAEISTRAASTITIACCATD